MGLQKYEILEGIRASGIIAVIRAQNKKAAISTARAILQGGISSIEITMTVPNAIEVLKDISDTFGTGNILLGAGTVLDEETARLAILAGAQYVVTPHLNLKIIKMCHRYFIPCLPGVGSVSELVQAIEEGVDVVKIFPGEVLGPEFIKAVHGPFPYANMIPTGGVSLDNIDMWLNAGAFAVGIGSSLTHFGTLKGDFKTVEVITRKVLERISQNRATF